MNQDQTLYSVLSSVVMLRVKPQVLLCMVKIFLPFSWTRSLPYFTRQSRP